MTAFSQGDYGKAVERFDAVHELFGLPPSISSPALRNAALSRYHAGDALGAFDVLAGLFRDRRLGGAALWNFAVFAAEARRYPDALSALDQWRERPADYLLARSWLLEAGLLALLGHEVDATEAIRRAKEADASYAESKLAAVGILVGRREVEAAIEGATGRELARALGDLLVVRKPDRYPQMNMLATADFQQVSKAIDLVRDDNLAAALNALDQMSEKDNPRALRAFVESAIRLLQGEPEKADGLLLAVHGIVSMPGSVWWNWAVAAFKVNDWRECAGRLAQCVRTDYATKGEAWVALALAAALTRDKATARDGSARACSLSERAKNLLATAVAGLNADTLAGLGLSLTDIQCDREVATRSPDFEQLKDAFHKGNLREAVGIFSAPPLPAVCELPEYERSPLEPDVVTTVPRSVIAQGMQADFRRGVAALINKDAAEAMRAFEPLARSLSRTRGVRVNWVAALFAAGRYPQALDEARRFVASSPEAYRVRDYTTLMACMIAEGQFREAEELLARLESEFGAGRCRLYRAVMAEALGPGHTRNLAEQLFELAKGTPEPSVELLRLCTSVCAEAKDWNRTKAVLEAVVRQEPIGAANAGVTSAGIAPRDCRTYAQMQEAYRRFEGRGDWRGAVDFFTAVELAQERRFFASSDRGKLLSLLNARTHLGRSLVYQRAFRAADEALRGVLELMGDHRESLQPEIEGNLAEAVADVYGLIPASLRQSESLEVARRAVPTRPSVVAALEVVAVRPIDSCRLSDALADMAVAIAQLPAVGGAGYDQVARSVEAAAALIHSVDVRRDVEAVFDFLRESSADTGPVSSHQAERAVSALDRIVLSFTLCLPAVSRAAGLDTLAQLEAVVQEAVEEATQPVCSLASAEAYHDGTDATLLLECRSRMNRPVGPVSVGLGKVKELQFVGPKAPVLRIEELGAGATAYIPLRFGITSAWPAARQTTVPFNVEVESPRRRFTESLRPVFSPFQPATVTYPGGAIDPVDVNGRPLYGRQPLVDRLAGSLVSPRQARLYFLCGPRKVGKTSILKFVASKIQLASPDCLCCIVNFDRDWPQGSPVARIAQDLVRESARSGRPAPPECQPLPTTMDEFEVWLERFKANQELNKVVLLLDEFGKLIDELARAGRGNALLGEFRNLWTNIKGVSLLVSDWHTREELSQWLPAQFWADLAIERVGFLDEGASGQAIRGPVEGTQVKFTDDAQDEIFRLTQGYPWHLQELCDLAVREAEAELRHTVVREDVGRAAKRLVEEPRTFQEGLFRKDRLRGIDEVVLWKIARYTEGEYRPIPMSALVAGKPPLAPEVVSLVIETLRSFSVLRVDGVQVSPCSPLVATWLREQFEEGQRLTEGPLPEGIKLLALRGCLLEDDVTRQVATLVEDLWECKARLIQTCHLRAIPKCFRNLDRSRERRAVSLVVDSREKWDPFIGSLKTAFVDDVDGKLNDLRSAGLTLLADALDHARLRRNFSEHPGTENRRTLDVERLHRLADIGANDPQTSEDWTRMQVGALARLVRAFEVQTASLIQDAF